MNLPPAVDASCKNSQLHVYYSPRSRRADKANANRKFRRKVNKIMYDFKTGRRDWDDEGFDDLGHELTSWEID